MPLHYTLLTYFFSSFIAKAKTSNAIGIANFGQALDKLNEARKSGKSVQRASWSERISYAWAALQLLVVLAGLTNRCEELIQANALIFTVSAARDTVILLLHERTEKKKEETVADTALRKKNDDIAPNGNDVTKFSNETKTPEQKVKDLIQKVRTTRAYDDLAWGIFQCAILYYNHGRVKSVGVAGFLFTFRAMERAFLNEKLRRRQRVRRFALICFMGYMTGRIVF